MKRRKIKLLGIVSFIIVIGLLIANLQMGHSRSKIQIFSSYGFSESNLFLHSIDESDKQQINAYLQNHYIKDEGFYLLINNDYTIFEKLYHAYCILSEINEEKNKEKLGILEDVFHVYELNIGNYSVSAYDYVYYLAIKHMLGENVPKEKYLEKLKMYQDKASGLIYYMSANEDLDTKLLITSKILNICNRHNIDIFDLQLKKKIIEISEFYELESYKEGESLYNSGGTLIYALSVCDYNVISEEQKKWFEEWQAHYENVVIDNENTFIDFYSYYQLANYFGDAQDDKIIDYVKGYESDVIHMSGMEMKDLYDYIIYEYKNILSQKQREVIELYVYNKIDEMSAAIIGNVDIASTFYGATLAYRTGFELDFAKVLDSVESIYKEITPQLNDEEFVYNTYYYVMMMTGFEARGVNDELKQRISSRLDDIIAKIVTSDNVDIRMLRMILEIKSNIAPYVLENEYNIIKEKIAKSIETPLYNSNIVEVIKIDKILGINSVKKSYIDECLSKLYAGGMYRCKVGEQADIKTTYMVYTLLTNHEILNLSKDVINDIVILLREYEDNALYKYELIDDYMDLRSIYYGYVLEKLTIGEKYAQ